MSILIELPILEEIYDLDTFSLQDVTDKISLQLQQLPPNPDAFSLPWKKKAHKFLDLAVLELKEREVIENFGDYCSKHINEPLINTPMYIPLENIEKLENSIEKPLENQIRIEKTRDSSHEISLPSISKQSISTRKEYKKPKESDLFLFMKETLAATRIQDNRLVIGKSTVGKYIPPKKKKNGKLKRSKTEDYESLKGLNKGGKGVVLPRIGKKEKDLGEDGKILMKKGKKNDENKKEIKEENRKERKNKGVIKEKEGSEGKENGKQEEKLVKNENGSLNDNLNENERSKLEKEAISFNEKKSLNFDKTNKNNEKTNLNEEKMNLTKEKMDLNVETISLNKEKMKKNEEKINLNEEKFKLNKEKINLKEEKMNLKKEKMNLNEEKANSIENKDFNEKNNLNNENIYLDEKNNLYSDKIDLNEKNTLNNEKTNPNEQVNPDETLKKQDFEDNTIENISIVNSNWKQNNKKLFEIEENQTINGLNTIKPEKNTQNEITKTEENLDFLNNSQFPSQNLNKNSDELPQKLDFQAKYKDFIEKAKTFHPTSLYDINESGESNEENLIDNRNHKKPEDNSVLLPIESIKLDKKPINPAEEPVNPEKELQNNQIKTHVFSLNTQKENENSNKLLEKENILTAETKKTTNNNNTKKLEIQEISKKDPLETLKNSKKTLEETLSKYKKEPKPLKSSETSQNIIKKPKPPIPKPPSKPKLPQYKLPYELDDSKVLDYSHFFQSFNSIFSGFYNNFHSPQNLDFSDIMKEIYNLFVQHVNKVDEVDKLLSNKHKLSLAPLEMNSNELFLMNDPKNLSYYAYRTNIDVKNFIARQQIFEKKMRGELQDEAIENTLYYRVVKNREEVYDIVTKSFLRKLNWAELPHGINLKTSWNLLWTWSKPQIDFNKLVYWQKVNHYPMNKNLVRKDLLKKNIEKMQKLGNKTNSLYNFIPQTYVLPKEYCQFMDHFYHDMVLEGKENIWIMKPIGKSRGRGISLLNDISNVVYLEQVIVQKYLKNPLLLRGFKFDMRIYVLVTSMQPLEVFIYKEGFARLSTEPFSLEPEDLNKLFIHLTNVAINKNNVDFNKDSDTLFGGSKLSLKNLKGKLEERGFSFNKIWTQVCEIVIKSLLACQQEIPNNPNCFELFGYDIIIDDNLKCWLLEVNSSPSLSRETILDDIVKQQLIDDVIELVDPVLFDRKKLLDVLERKIKEEQGLKSNINTQNNSKQQMNRDLTYILNGKNIRKVGEIPKFMGNFERLAPSEFCDKVVKTIQNYKVGGGTKTYSSIE